MLKRAKKKYRPINIAPVKGADVLYETMHRYRTEMREIILVIREAYKSIKMDERIKLAEIRGLTQQLLKIDEFIVDIAHKLAPYQSPKLETIEVKNQIEHKFVLRAPTPIANVQDWMQKTGAEKLNSDQINPIRKEVTPQEPSIHDFDDDEVETFKKLH